MSSRVDAEVDEPGQIDLRNPDTAAFLKWPAEGDANKRLLRKGQPPTQVFAKLEKTAPIPLGK